VFTLRDGRWWDAEQARWRNGEGRALRRNLPSAEEMLRQLRRTRVVLATAHRNHDPTDNRSCNLLALCQRCHLSHDRAEHQRRRWLTLFSRKAVGDLFLGTYRQGKAQSGCQRMACNTLIRMMRPIDLAMRRAVNPRTSLKIALAPEFLQSVFHPPYTIQRDGRRME
jgi:hypothetical protein